MVGGRPKTLPGPLQSLYGPGRVSRFFLEWCFSNEIWARTQLSKFPKNRSWNFHKFFNFVWIFTKMNRNSVAKLCDLKTIKLHPKTCPRKLYPLTTNKNSRKNVFSFSIKFLIFSCHADYLILLLSFFSCLIFSKLIWRDFYFWADLGDCLGFPGAQQTVLPKTVSFFLKIPATPRQCAPKFSHFFWIKICNFW